MADIVKIALFGAAAWVGYEFFLKPSTTAAASSSTPGTTSTTPPPAPPNPNAITGANTLDGVYAKMVAAAPSGFTGTVDDWNVYLTQAMPAGFAAPDPMPIFSGIPGFDRSQKIAANQYWNYMAPYLKANAGLSGMGPRGLGWMHGVGR